PSTTADVTVHDAFAYVFTSGTTGMPKAAYQFHRSWIKAGHFIGKVMLKLTPKDRFYVSLPFFHTNPVKIGWGAPHVSGAAIVMVRKFSTSRFWDDVKHYRITAMNYVGELCTYLANQPERPDDANHSLRGMIGNGIRPDVFGVFKKRFKVDKVIELYGASEFDLSFVNMFGLEGTIGFNIGSTFALAKYDVDNDELVRDDKGFLIQVEKGEPGILLGEAKESIDITGYTSKEATEKKMIYDAFEKGDRWFNTGDLLRNIGFGHHEFADRTGDTFRWKGENVSTMEVEKVANSFGQVEQSTAYGIKIGDGDGRMGMLALLPNESGDAFDLEGFGSLLADSLPSYAVPRFLRLKTEFESTPTFKIKKNPLRDEGFDPTKISDPLLVILPGDNKYQPLTEQLFAEIEAGKYRF
ncbi:MAG: long-chain-acyl-CoA synthetase, partial [Proteobacteria bacterium]|nr:long-chain-acyl-CoA synthetase [Pseudomonadota bacterium]